MKGQDTSLDIWDLDDPSVEQSLADDNLDSQAHLWELLAKARLESGKSDDEVAQILGVSTELLSAIEGGRINLTLSDLREYAYSIDALVSYRVISRYSEKLEGHRADISNKPWHKDSSPDYWERNDARQVALMWARARA